MVTPTVTVFVVTNISCFNDAVTRVVAPTVAVLVVTNISHVDLSVFIRQKVTVQPSRLIHLNVRTFAVDLKTCRDFRDGVSNTRRDTLTYKRRLF